MPPLVKPPLSRRVIQFQWPRPNVKNSSEMSFLLFLAILKISSSLLEAVTFYLIILIFILLCCNDQKIIFILISPSPFYRLWWNYGLILIKHNMDFFDTNI